MKKIFCTAFLTVFLAIMTASCAGSLSRKGEPQVRQLESVNVIFMPGQKEEERSSKSALITRAPEGSENSLFYCYSIMDSEDVYEAIGEDGKTFQSGSAFGCHDPLTDGPYMFSTGNASVYWITQSAQIGENFQRTGLMKVYIVFEEGPALKVEVCGSGKDVLCMTEGLAKQIAARTSVKSERLNNAWEQRIADADTEAGKTAYQGTVAELAARGAHNMSLVRSMRRYATVDYAEGDGVLYHADLYEQIRFDDVCTDVRARTSVRKDGQIKETEHREYKQTVDGFSAGVAAEEDRTGTTPVRAYGDYPLKTVSHTGGLYAVLQKIAAGELIAEVTPGQNAAGDPATYDLKFDMMLHDYMLLAGTDMSFLHAYAGSTTDYDIHSYVTVILTLDAQTGLPQGIRVLRHDLNNYLLPAGTAREADITEKPAYATVIIRYEAYNEIGQISRGLDPEIEDDPETVPGGNGNRTDTGTERI